MSLKTLLSRASESLDEVLYGDLLARIRWHQDRIDEIRAGSAEPPAEPGKGAEHR